MSLPGTIDPSTPAGSDSPSLGDDHFRALKTYIIDVFGVPNNSAVTAAAFSVSTAGVVNVLQTPLTLPTMIQGTASQVLNINTQYSRMNLMVGTNPILSLTATGVLACNVFFGGQIYPGSRGTAITTATGMLDASQLTVGLEKRGDILHRGHAGWTGLAQGASGQFLQSQGVGADAKWSTVSAASSDVGTVDIISVFDGAGGVLGSGIRLDLPLDFNATIQSATLVGYPTGNLVVDVYKTPYASFPGSTGQSITASAKPTLTNAIKYQDTTLTGWTTAITAGDILRYNIDSVSSTILATLSLKVVKI